MFAPGFEMNIEKINSTGLATTKKDNSYSGKVFSTSKITFTGEVEDGMIFTDASGNALNYFSYSNETMASKLFASLDNSTDTKVYLFKKLLDKIVADNDNKYPSSGTFAKAEQEFKDISVDKTKTIDYIKLTTNYIVKVYSIKVGDKTISVGVKSVHSRAVTVEYKAGHAHGDDANAGGGIVDFE